MPHGRETRLPGEHGIGEPLPGAVAGTPSAKYSFKVGAIVELVARATPFMPPGRYEVLRRLPPDGVDNRRA